MFMEFLWDFQGDIPDVGVVYKVTFMSNPTLVELLLS